MKIYPAKKKGFFLYIMLGLFLLIIGIIIADRKELLQQPFILLSLLSPLALLLWVYLDTFYSIEGEQLKWKSAFMRGTIDIQKIRSIMQGKTLIVGMKPALAEKGLIIKYNKFDTIYIAPESNEELVADLLAINADILVKG